MSAWVTLPLRRLMSSQEFLNLETKELVSFSYIWLWVLASVKVVLSASCWWVVFSSQPVLLHFLPPKYTHRWQLCMLTSGPMAMGRRIWNNPALNFKLDTRLPSSPNTLLAIFSSLDSSHPILVCPLFNFSSVFFNLTYSCFLGQSSLVFLFSGESNPFSQGYTFLL